MEENDVALSVFMLTGLGGVVLGSPALVIFVMICYMIRRDEGDE